MVNRFVLNGISYHGKGAIRELPGIVREKGLKKAFVASDPDLVRFGVTAKVTDILEKEGMQYEVYTDIKPNPTIENVKLGVACYKSIGQYVTGMAFSNVGLGIAHSMAHTLGAVYDTPHGVACDCYGI